VNETNSSPNPLHAASRNHGVAFLISSRFFQVDEVSSEMADDRTVLIG